MQKLRLFSYGLIGTTMVRSHAKRNINLDWIHRIDFDQDEIGSYAFSKNIKTHSGSSDIGKPDL
jgi:hypothetical protein